VRQLHLAKALLVLILMSWCVSRIGFLFSHEYGDDRAEGVRAALGVVALAALAGTALLAALRVIPRHLTVLTVVFVAACALAPYPMLGDPWGPVAGLASAIALFLLPKHHSWLVFVLLVAADLTSALVFQTGASPQALLGRFVIDVMVGVWVFGVMLLVDLAARAQSEQNTLAAMALGEERIRSAARLHSSVGADLAASRRLTAFGTDRDTEARMTQVADRARRAAAAVRALADTRNEIDTPRRPDGTAPDVSPRLARLFAAALVLGSAVLTFVNLTNFGVESVHGWVAATGAVLAVTALQLYHGTPDRGGRPPQWWQWTLPAHITLLTVMLGLGGIRFAALVPLVIGSAIYRCRPVWAGATATAILLIQQATLPAGSSWGDRLYFLSSGAICVAVYAYCRVPSLIRSIQEAGDGIVWLTVLQERLRLERDVHDFLGRHLSAIGMKAELAARLSSLDPGRAASEIDQLTSTVDRALVELRTLTDRTPTLRFDHEVHAARELLHAAGIDFRTETSDVIVNPRIDAILATVLRESATNAVRHGTGSCLLTLTEVDGHIRLTLSNDVADTPAHDTGNGLMNLAARVTEAGGRFEVLRGNVFTVTAELPSVKSSLPPPRSGWHRPGFVR
jgi:two-component system sensor histidine kinase DesK